MARLMECAGRTFRTNHVSLMFVPGRPGGNQEVAALCCNAGTWDDPASARRRDPAGTAADGALFIEQTVAVPAHRFKANAIVITTDPRCFASGAHSVSPAIILIGRWPARFGLFRPPLSSLLPSLLGCQVPRQIFAGKWNALWHENCSLVKQAHPRTGSGRIRSPLSAMAPSPTRCPSRAATNPTR
jgi:hypothetical protein